MQVINGSYEQDNHGVVEQSDTVESPPPKRRTPPTHVIVIGRVVTRIRANRSDWGHVAWNVDQRLVNYASASGWLTRSIPSDSLDDAMRGMFAAQRWIRRAKQGRLTPLAVELVLTGGSVQILD